MGRTPVMGGMEMRGLKIAAALASAMALSACGVALANRVNSATTTAELAEFTNKQLCHPLVKDTQAVSGERLRRGLGDCSNEHAACVQSGYPLGHPDYLRCRQVMAQAGAYAAEKDAADVQQSLMLMRMMTPPQPTIQPPVTCQPNGAGFSCW